MKKDVFKLVMFSMVLAFGLVISGCNNGNDDPPPDEVVAQNITAAEVNACPTIGGFKDIDALIETKLASDANDTFTFPAGVNVAVSVSNIGRARITIPSSVIKGVKGVSTEAQLNTYKATASWIDTLGGMKIPYTLPVAQVAHKVAFAKLGGTELVPVYVHNGMIDQVNTSAGGQVQRQFTDNVALFFYGETLSGADMATKADSAEAKLNAQNLHLAAGQPTGSNDDANLNGKRAFYVLENGANNNDVAKLKMAVISGYALNSFTGLTIFGLGTIGAANAGVFTYDTSVL
ncbi:hypothetical protein AGMMS4952_12620 [Spirochaetia bacterium]|nr:hypothetical protein AGMMS4952_12620 [Spirochaetia bacterium]